MEFIWTYSTAPANERNTIELALKLVGGSPENLDSWVIKAVGKEEPATLVEPKKKYVLVPKK